MQKARRLSAAALWSRSFNPLHLSSLPPPHPPHLTAPSISFLHLPPPPPWASLRCLVHISLLLTCWLQPNSSSLYGVASAFSPPAAAKPLQQILQLANQHDWQRSAGWTGKFTIQKMLKKGKTGFKLNIKTIPTLFTRRRHLFRQGQQNRKF